jgi:hypothetical protein
MSEASFNEPHAIASDARAPCAAVRRRHNKLQGLDVRTLALSVAAAAIIACGSTASTPLPGVGPVTNDASPNTTDAGERAAGPWGDDAGGDETAPSDATATGDAASNDAASSDGDASRDGASNGGEAGAGTLGYMVGIKTNGVPTGPAKVEGWLGRPMDIAGTTITTTSYIGSGTPYTTKSGAHPLLECSFPLLSIFGESNGLDDMAEAASGAYDATYEAMAEALASWANPLLSVRIGWEFNGNWYAWSNGVGTHATYANYVAAFKRAAALVRKHNPHVLIQWNVAWGQPDPTPYWPGAYDAASNVGGVDVVSMDFYQANISEYNNGGKQSAWSLAQSGVTIDLDWMVTFAKSKGVKIALSEYGAGTKTSGGEGSGPGLDDGPWTAASIAWMNAQSPGFFLWTAWSDDEPADDIVTANANPAEQAAWSAAWKGTRFGGSWWAGTAPP